MKKMLMIGLVALVFTSCQSESTKKESILIPTPTGVPSAPSQSTASGQRPATNPEHGQPFHDCALPVGAAFAAENVQPQPMKAPVEVQQPAAPVTKEVKLNPAHGAPGHRCEIAVGAPLT